MPNETPAPSGPALKDFHHTEEPDIGASGAKRIAGIIIAIVLAGFAAYGWTNGYFG